MDTIKIKGAREHNLKNIDVEIPKNKLVVFTGLSGSGKSSLAFDTIYAEGQRRYVESLSSYARQFLGIMKKPDVDVIEGLSPAISIDQKGTSHNPRSTVGTVTEIYDYLRLLFARVGHPHCPICGREIAHMSKDQITDAIMNLPGQKSAGKQGLRILILAPIVKDRKGEYADLFRDLKKRGYKKVRVDGKIYGTDEDLVLIKTNKHTIDAVIDSMVLSKETDRLRLSNDIEQALKLGNSELKIAIIHDKGFTLPEFPKEMEDELFSEKFACPVDNISLPEIEPRIFSFNTPHGACPNCNGLGTVLTVDPDRVFNNNLSISEGGILPFANNMMHDSWFTRTIKTFADENNIPLNKQLSEISADKKKLLLNGTGNREYTVVGENRWGRTTEIHESFNGIIAEVKNKYAETESLFMKGLMEKFMRYETCTQCHGSRLKKEALSVTIDDKSIMDVTDMAIDETLRFIESLPGIFSDREGQIGRLILKEIKERLSFLVDVGLDYLTLSRGAHTLAGGEAQRIRLASQIGSGLTGVLYVLDEPSIGLHPKDNTKLIKTLKRLRDLGNTVLVVEHDQETMEESDLILDFGPAAGSNGGQIIAKGTPAEIKKDSNSVTGKYLSGKKQINVVASTQPVSERLDFEQRYLTIHGASEHNLKNITVNFPLQKLVVVTGASGSGKSTLINDILDKALSQRKGDGFFKEKPGAFKLMTGDEHIRHVFTIDQSPIGRTPRSNPATYTGAFNYIRDIFASTKEAKLRGYGPGRFSFNVKGGRCEACQGEGQIKIEMQFLPDVYVPCEVCAGTQYNSEALEILFNNKNISEVLNMSAFEALDFFSFHPTLSYKLQTLVDVGLSYIKLGQPAPTLSGGEAQRIKLASELSKRGRDALYMLDEPTTGLHFADLEKLLHVLRRLVDVGNTVIVIEHNLDVIKNADYIIDLGPDGGDKGGNLVVTGTPQDVADHKTSYTGQFLRKVLKK
ncbi:MAG: excinuclease ABC subunit UvrA [Patescibacteria group bacterium]|nr:excinuclease ABC subunit UvrA [Patescibacteria group bacterium]MDE2588652.1 excinuclease ABC subunit UvrA [Patescibacteria group bacterium]